MDKLRKIFYRWNKGKENFFVCSFNDVNVRWVVNFSFHN